MKGIVLALCGLFVVVLSAAAAGDEFNLTNITSVTRDADGYIRTLAVSSNPVVLLVTDARTELRGGKPTIAYTVFRFTSQTAEFSVQPVIGSINGAQVQLSF